MKFTDAELKAALAGNTITRAAELLGCHKATVSRRAAAAGLLPTPKAAVAYAYDTRTLMDGVSAECLPQGGRIWLEPWEPFAAVSHQGWLWTVWRRKYRPSNKSRPARRAKETA